MMYNKENKIQRSLCFGLNLLAFNLISFSGSILFLSSLNDPTQLRLPADGECGAGLALLSVLLCRVPASLAPRLGELLSILAGLSRIYYGGGGPLQRQEQDA